MPGQQMSSLNSRAGFALIAGLLGFAAVLFAPQILNDSDTYWHIRAGEWMLNHHAILRSDPFSYTMMGAPWNAQEWLAEIIMAFVWRAGSWDGLHILFGLATGATFLIMAAELRRRLDGVSALLSFVMGMACLSASLLARPHMLAMPLLAAWCVSLVCARDENRAPSFKLLPLMLFWANLHGSFVFGLAFAGALALDAVAESTSERGKTAHNWAFFGVAAVAMALFTPQGLNGLLFPLRLTAMHGISHIGEWQAATFEQVSPLELAIFAAIFVLATRGVRMSALRAVTLLGLLYVSLQHIRHEMLLGIAGPLLLAKPLSDVGSGGQEDRAMGTVLTFIPAALICIAALVALRVFLPTQRLDDRVTPAAAIASVPMPLRQAAVLNDYAFGGYLIFENIRPFIDSRADLYGDRFLENYAGIIAPDRTVIAKDLAHYRVRWTIFSAGSPTVAVLDSLPGWHRLHSDSIAVVHVHD